MAYFFIDYEKMVVQTYEQKKINNTLPYGLMHLTRARLREECLMRCGKGGKGGKDLNKRDEKIVRDFCGDWDESKNCQAVMELCDPDKFRPLENYLKGKSESTDPKNIELLAWLIDFPGRPWEMGKEYPGELNDNAPLSDTNPSTTNPVTAADNPLSDEDNMQEANTPVNSENTLPPVGLYDTNEAEGEYAETADAGNQVVKSKPAKRLAATVMLSLALATGGAWLWKGMDAGQKPGGGCMYWSGDHYKPVACDQKIPNAMIIALDTFKLKNFRKITTPDTITYGAIGKVWYSKINSKLEFYTSDGAHPVIYGHQLKPITIYIVDKYIRSGMLSSSN